MKPCNTSGAQIGPANYVMSKETSNSLRTNCGVPSRPIYYAGQTQVNGEKRRGQWKNQLLGVMLMQIKPK